MDFRPFGFASAKGRQPKRPKAGSLAEFSEPTDDVPASADLSDAEKATEVKRLQEEGSKKAENGAFSEAIRLFNQAIALDANVAVLHELKAQVLLESELYWDAVCSATQATNLAPSWPDAHLTLARAQLCFGEPEAALHHMEKTLALEPGHAGAKEEIDTVRMLVMQRKSFPEENRQRLRTT